MATFEVLKPFEIPVIVERVKIPDQDKINEKWKTEWAEAADRKGCYIFAVRAAKGYVPIYIGQAKKSFKQECFTSHKLVKLMKVFARQSKGTPIMLLVCHPAQKGKPNAREIGEIEKFLIDLGYAKNPNLQNDRGISRPRWSIAGAVRSSKGKPSEGASVLRRTFDLD